MAAAGRILIMPKGVYDSSVTYEMLDLVHYKGVAWLAKKTVAGIEPSESNGEHWHKLCESIDFTTKTYSGTTDSNGFLKPEDITVNNTAIVSCQLVSGDGFCTQFNNTDAYWSFKAENWDRTPIANQSITIKVIYMPI